MPQQTATDRASPSQGRQQTRPPMRSGAARQHWMCPNFGSFVSEHLPFQDSIFQFCKRCSSDNDGQRKQGPLVRHTGARWTADMQWAATLLAHDGFDEMLALERVGAKRWKFSRTARRQGRPEPTVVWRSLLMSGFRRFHKRLMNRALQRRSGWFHLDAQGLTTGWRFWERWRVSHTTEKHYEHRQSIHGGGCAGVTHTRCARPGARRLLRSPCP